MEISISLPSLPEQEKIGALFEQLDSHISKNQQKLEKLKNMKHSFLQKLFPKAGTTVPELRFKGFEGAWKEKKLGEICNKIKEKNTNGIFSETFTNSAEFGIISQKDFFDHDISNIENLKGYYIVENNDFVYNPRISNFAPVGPINRNKLRRTGVMSPLYTILRFCGNNFIFLEYLFKNSVWHNYMFLNGDSGARSDRFSIKDDVFFKMPLRIPSLPEQEKIGALFEKLDTQITQQTQKLEKLKNLKQSLLEKMFI
ncbi:MAG: restriction endonuclease subunit S [Candidatus Absconditicoccaceae bacterium]